MHYTPVHVCTRITIKIHINYAQPIKYSLLWCFFMRTTIFLATHRHFSFINNNWVRKQYTIFFVPRATNTRTRVFFRTFFLHLHLKLIISISLAKKRTSRKKNRKQYVIVTGDNVRLKFMLSQRDIKCTMGFGLHRNCLFSVTVINKFRLFIRVVNWKKYSDSATTLTTGWQVQKTVPMT